MKKEAKSADNLLPFVGAIGGLAAVGSRGYHVKYCRLCNSPISGGDGYRIDKELGTIHATCAKQREKEQKENKGIRANTD